MHEALLGANPETVSGVNPDTFSNVNAWQDAVHPPARALTRWASPICFNPLDFTR